MAVREGKWRCPSCDAVNKGRDMKCASCGNVRGEDVKFFLEEDAAEVTDQSMLNQAKAGADWHCDFCGTDNRADADVCKQCGAPAAGMKRRQQTMTGSAAEANTAQVKPAPKKNPLTLIISIAAVAIVAVTLLFLFRGKEDSIRLEGGEWTRSIAIETQEWVKHEAWYDQVPREGEILRTWDAQRSTEMIQVGTERVKTGTKDMGNGYFEDVYEDRPVYEERPIMDTKAEYRILEWQISRSVENSGDLSKPVEWPEINLSEGEREGKRSENALLYFRSTDPDKQDQIYQYNQITPAEMNQFQKGVNYQAVVSGDKVRRFLED